MKISEINETISIIANIGVIGSIIFLGLEMQQNTEMMQSQTRNSIVENQLSLLERAIDNNDFAKIAFEFYPDIMKNSVESFTSSCNCLRNPLELIRFLYIFIRFD